MKRKHDSEKYMLLGRRIRELRKMKGWTQEELGERSDISYKYLGEIERGNENPSYEILLNLAEALDVDLPDMFRTAHEVSDRSEIERGIIQIIQRIPDEALRNLLLVLTTLYPVQR